MVIVSSGQHLLTRKFTSHTVKHVTCRYKCSSKITILLLGDATKCMSIQVGHSGSPYVLITDREPNLNSVNRIDKL